MNNVDLEKAMSSIRQNIESQQREKVELATGPAGPRGEKGEQGSAGLPATVSIGVVRSAEKAAANVRLTNAERNEYSLDLSLPRGTAGERGERGSPGQSAQLRIGTVVSGDKPDASIRPGGDGVFFLDLVLEKGARGAIGNRGEQGIPGLAGRDGKNGVDGRDGQDGIGIQGAPGKDGLTEEEIRKIVVGTIISTLTDAGVMTELGKKIVAARVELKRKANEATVRNIGEIRDFAKGIDKILGDLG